MSRPEDFWGQTLSIPQVDNSVIAARNYPMFLNCMGTNGGRTYCSLSKGMNVYTVRERRNFPGYKNEGRRSLEDSSSASMSIK